MIDTHVLLDEAGVPLLRGTQDEMMEQSAICAELGVIGAKVKAMPTWRWDMINWGD